MSRPRSMPSLVEELTEGDLSEPTGTEGAYAHVPVFHISDIQRNERDDQRTRMMSSAAFEAAAAAANDDGTRSPDRELARGEERYALETDAFITVGDNNPLRYRTVNLSPRGLFVDATQGGGGGRLQVGSTCRVHLRRGKRRVEFDAEVVREEIIKLRWHRRYGYGLRVVLLTRESQAELEKMIAEAAAPSTGAPVEKNNNTALMIVIAMLLGLIGLGLAAYAYRGARGNAPPAVLANVERGEIGDIVRSISGEVVPQHRVTLRSAQLQPRAMKPLVKDGDRVTKGDIVAEPLDDEDRNALIAAKNRVAAAEAELKRASANPEYPEEIVRRRAALLTSRTQLDTRVANFQRTQVVAPIDGVVVGMKLQTGEIVSPAAAICEVVDDASLRVQARFSEAAVTRIAVGSQADVLVAGFKTPILAMVDRVGDVVQEGAKERTVAVDLTLPSDVHVRPGSSAKVMVEVDRKKNVVLVPTKALVGKDSNHRRVYVVTSDDRYEPREITIGISDVERTEVVGGLDERARVVVEPGPEITGEARAASP